MGNVKSVATGVLLATGGVGARLQPHEKETALTTQQDAHLALPANLAIANRTGIQLGAKSHEHDPTALLPGEKPLFDVEQEGLGQQRSAKVLANAARSELRIRQAVAALPGKVDTKTVPALPHQVQQNRDKEILKQELLLKAGEILSQHPAAWDIPSAMQTANSTLAVIAAIKDEVANEFIALDSAHTAYKTAVETYNAAVDKALEKINFPLNSTQIAERMRELCLSDACYALTAGDPEKEAYLHDLIAFFSPEEMNFTRAMINYMQPTLAGDMLREGVRMLAETAAPTAAASEAKASADQTTNTTAATAAPAKTAGTEGKEKKDEKSTVGASFQAVIAGLRWANAGWAQFQKSSPKPTVDMLLRDAERAIKTLLLNTKDAKDIASKTNDAAQVLKQYLEENPPGIPGFDENFSNATRLVEKTESAGENYDSAEDHFKDVRKEVQQGDLARAEGVVFFSKKLAASVAQDVEKETGLLKTAAEAFVDQTKATMDAMELARIKVQSNPNSSAAKKEMKKAVEAAQTLFNTAKNMEGSIKKIKSLQQEASKLTTEARADADRLVERASKLHQTTTTLRDPILAAGNDFKGVHQAAIELKEAWNKNVSDGDSEIQVHPQATEVADEVAAVSELMQKSADRVSDAYSQAIHTSKAVEKLHNHAQSRLNNATNKQRNLTESETTQAQTSASINEIAKNVEELATYTKTLNEEFEQVFGKIPSFMSPGDLAEKTRKLAKKLERALEKCLTMGDNESAPERSTTTHHQRGSFERVTAAAERIQHLSDAVTNQPSQERERTSTAAQNRANVEADTVETSNAGLSVVASEGTDAEATERSTRVLSLPRLRDPDEIQPMVAIPDAVETDTETETQARADAAGEIRGNIDKLHNDVKNIAKQLTESSSKKTLSDGVHTPLLVATAAIIRMVRLADPEDISLDGTTKGQLIAGVILDALTIAEWHTNKERSGPVLGTYLNQLDRNRLSKRDSDYRETTSSPTQQEPSSAPQSRLSSIGSALLSGASRFSSHFFSQGGAYANIGYLSTGIAQAVHQFKDGRPVAAGFTIAASAVDGLNGFHQLFTSIPHKDGKDSWWTKTKETANKWYPNWARGTTRMLAATSGGPVSLGLLNGAKDS